MPTTTTTTTKFETPSQVIHHVLKELEERRNIRILYAADTGSRSVGLEAPGSDYDLKVVYVERMEWYLRIDEENLEHEIVEKFNFEPCQVAFDCSSCENGVFHVEIMGFNLRKCLQLLRKSNPTFLEMVRSPLVYANDNLGIMDSIRTELNVYFSQKTLSFHYINVAKQNFVDYLRNKKLVNHKKYLYILLTLFRVLYMKLKSTELGETTHLESGMELMDVFPPLNYLELCDALRQSGIIKQQYESDLQYLIDRKRRECGQWDREEPMPLMYTWIEEMRRETKQYADDVLAMRKRYYDTLDANQVQFYTQKLTDIFLVALNKFDQIDAILPYESTTATTDENN